MLSLPEPWLQKWIAPLLQRHPEVEQVYLLGNQARGAFGQKPNYSLLFYAGYDCALELLTALAREENEFRTDEGILHLYVENYGATFCGIWGGALIPNELNNSWVEEVDYKLWIEMSQRSRPLCERLRLPQERRQSERRSDPISHGAQLGAALQRDELAPVFPKVSVLEVSTPEILTSETSAAVSERRDRRERRRDIWEWMPLLND